MAAESRAEVASRRAAGYSACAALGLLLLAGLPCQIGPHGKTEEQTPVRVLLDRAKHQSYGIYVALDKGALRRRRAGWRCWSPRRQDHRGSGRQRKADFDQFQKLSHMPGCPS